MHLFGHDQILGIQSISILHLIHHIIVVDQRAFSGQHPQVLEIEDLGIDAHEGYGVVGVVSGYDGQREDGVWGGDAHLEWNGLGLGWCQGCEGCHGSPRQRA